MELLVVPGRVISTFFHIAICPFLSLWLELRNIIVTGRPAQCHKPYRNCVLKGIMNDQKTIVAYGLFLQTMLEGNSTRDFS